MTTVTVRSSIEFPFTITPNAYDDTGLDPYTYRVYGRLARRAGGVPGQGGTCFESITSMAEACQISRRKFGECIAKLINLNMIERTDFENSASHFNLTDPKVWKPCTPESVGLTPIGQEPIAPPAHHMRTPAHESNTPCAPHAQAPSILGFKRNHKKEPIKGAKPTKPPAESRPKTKAVVLRTESKEPTAGSKVWDAYSLAWKNRYGVDPVRNAKTNSLCKQLVERLGEEAAPVAAFYIENDRDKFWVKQLHPLNLLVSNAERLGAEYRGFQSVAAEEQEIRVYREKENQRIAEEKSKQAVIAAKEHEKLVAEQKVKEEARRKAEARKEAAETRRKEIEAEVQQVLKIHGKEAAIRKRNEMLGTNPATRN